MLSAMEALMGALDAIFIVKIAKTIFCLLVGVALVWGFHGLLGRSSMPTDEEGPEQHQLRLEKLEGWYVAETLRRRAGRNRGGS